MPFKQEHFYAKQISIHEDENNPNILNLGFCYWSTENSPSVYVKIEFCDVKDVQQFKQFVLIFNNRDKIKNVVFKATKGQESSLLVTTEDNFNISLHGEVVDHELLREIISWKPYDGYFNFELKEIDKIITINGEKYKQIEDSELLGEQYHLFFYSKDMAHFLFPKFFAKKVEVIRPAICF